MLSVVTGCIISGCPQEPAWLVEGYCRHAGLHVQIHVPVCERHLGIFGMELDGSQGETPPIRFLTAWPRAEIIFDQRYPIRIRVVRNVELEEVAP